ncbi:hypothetical protein [Halobaculum sp. D14]|uniref:RPA family protein n=1 Tax=Halobaculum sp. D14 TaxID=3421642 RepID=UPI003EB89177
MSGSDGGGDDGPGNREVAHRVFAAEFDDASLEYSESDEERAPNYVVTPTGLRVNRLFAVGVLTEVESVNEQMLRGRVVDPTGAFVTKAGQYQPDEVAFLDRAEPPAFVALSGKARTFQPDDADVVYTSVRPESLSHVDADTRDRWTVSAAEATLDRLAVVGRALEMDERGDALERRLAAAGVPTALAAGIPRALDHYGTTEHYLEAVRRLAVEALEVVAGDRDEVGRLSTNPADAGPDELGALPAVDYDFAAAAETVEAVDAEATGQAAEAAGSADDEPATDSADSAESPGTAGTAESAETADATESAETADGAESAATSTSAAGSTESVVDEADESAADEAAEPAEAAGPTGDADVAEADPSAAAEPEPTEAAETASTVAAADDDSDAAVDSDGPADSDGPGDFDAGDAGLGDFDAGGADESPTTEEPESMTENDTTDESAEDGVDEEEFEDALSDEEREAVEAEHGVEFATGSDVPDPGEAGIETPAPEDTPAGMDEDVETDLTTEPEPSAAETEPAAEDRVGDAPADDTPPADPDVDEPEFDPSEAEPTSEAAVDEEPPEELDLDEAVVELMDEFDEGDGAAREDVVAAAVDRFDVSEEAADDAIQDALMSGKCYEPDEATLKPI